MADGTGTDGVKLEWRKNDGFTYVYELVINDIVRKSVWITKTSTRIRLHGCGPVDVEYPPDAEEEVAAIALALGRMEGVL
jgi:hypothetical protein